MISIAFDRGYRCEECDKDLDLFEGCCERTWVCKTCGNPAFVLAGDGDFEYLFRRLPVSQIKSGDYVGLYGRPVGELYRVFTSEPGKKNEWLLRLEGYGTKKTSPSRFVSVLV